LITAAVVPQIAKSDPGAAYDHRVSTLPGRQERIGGLMLSCHPGPVLAVTTLAVLLAVTAGAPAGTCLLVALAVLVGQLSIGWGNDWLDAGRDLAVGRADKPIATGAVPRHWVGWAAAAAAGVSVPLSLALGPWAGAAHLVGVASGWAYDLGLKATIWSWAPYAVTFGLLPAVVTLALPHPAVAAGWAVGAGALIGVGAHLVNVLPDLEQDRATGVRGLPQRLGRVGTGVLAPLVLLGASALIALGRPGDPTPVDGVVLVGVLVAAVTAAVTAATSDAATGRGRRLPLLATVAVAVLDVATLALHGNTGVAR
jgi:4-hydroxybenzoate polyprenyltransferase